MTDIHDVTTAVDQPADWAWPWSAAGLVMWAAHGAGYDIGDPVLAAALHEDGWDPRTALASVSGDNALSQQPASVLLAAAWAGFAEYATARRDEAIRAAVDNGRSQRQVAAHVGLSHPGVARIVQRAPAGRPPRTP